MVLQNSNTTSAKRSPSSSRDEPNSMLSRRNNLHYALIYLDSSENIRVELSSALYNVDDESFITPEFRRIFYDSVKRNTRNELFRLKPSRTRVYDDHKSKRRVSHDADLYFEDLQPAGKRRKLSAPELPGKMECIGSPQEDEEDPSKADRIPLRIGDEEKVLAYYYNALKHFQQINCRFLAKAFIKLIEPRKQVKHPYNGGKPGPGAAPGEKGDPELTKPGWWPPGVIHKEPDHLRKKQRLKLMVHIIRNLGSLGITADKLLEVVYESKRNLKPAERLEIIEEILRVRKLEERYERNEVDADTIIYVVNRGSTAKYDKDMDSTSERDDKDAEAEDFKTPASTAASQSDSLTTPVDPLNTPKIKSEVDEGDPDMRMNTSFEFKSQTTATQPPPFSTPAANIKQEMIPPSSVTAFPVFNLPNPRLMPPQQSYMEQVSGEQQLQTLGHLPVHHQHPSVSFEQFNSDWSPAYLQHEGTATPIYGQGGFGGGHPQPHTLGLDPYPQYATASAAEMIPGLNETRAQSFPVSSLAGRTGP